MTRNRLLLATFVLVCVLVAAGCGGGGKSSSSSSGGNGVPADAVALVAGHPVLRADLDELMRTAELGYKQNKQSFPKVGTAEYQALQQQAAVYLVTDTEYRLEAAKLGITITDADVKRALDALVKQRFGGDQKKFQQYLKTTGYALQDFQVGERRQLLRTRLAAAITKGVKVTPAAVKAYYDAHKAQAPYTTPAQRRVRHILVAVNAKGAGVGDKGVTDTKVDFARSKALADKLYNQLANGASFVALVKKYSQDAGSKTKGGEYTDVKGSFVPEFEKAAFSLKTNEISKPVKSQYGYHLIEPLAAIKPGKTESFEQAQASIRKTLLDQKRNDALTAWAQTLGTKYKGKVRYASGFAPPQTTSTSTTTSP